MRKKIELELSGIPPYFAEIPYYVWGDINYDSDGDCKFPTDRTWDWLELRHRKTDEWLEISRENAFWTILGSGSGAERVVRYLAERCDGEVSGGHASNDTAWNHSSGVQRAAHVIRVFADSRLAPLDRMVFFGGWKWISHFATEFTWVYRYMIHSVLHNDKRIVPVCVDVLQQVDMTENIRSGIQYVLAQLTGLSFHKDRDWKRWYQRGTNGREKGKRLYPKPDIQEWYDDLKQMYATWNLNVA